MTTPASSERGEVVITGATVVTMDPELGDVGPGAVHVRDGVIDPSL